MADALDDLLQGLKSTTSPDSLDSLLSNLKQYGGIGASPTDSGSLPPSVIQGTRALTKSILPPMQPAPRSMPATPAPQPPPVSASPKAPNVTSLAGVSTPQYMKGAQSNIVHIGVPEANPLESIGASKGSSSDSAVRSVMPLTAKLGRPPAPNYGPLDSFLATLVRPPGSISPTAVIPQAERRTAKQGQSATPSTWYAGAKPAHIQDRQPKSDNQDESSLDSFLSTLYRPNPNIAVPTGVKRNSLSVSDLIPTSRFSGLQPTTFPSLLEDKGTPNPPVAVTHTKIGDSDKYPVSPLLQTPAPTGNHIIVSLADKKVVVQNSKGETIKEYPVYIGTSASPTPRGEFRIMENVSPGPDEWYYDHHWLGFQSSGERYTGFHGWVYTPNDDEVEKEEPGWKTSTHGCIQMRNPDVAEFSKLVGVGDPVTILDRPLNPPPAKPQLPEELR